MASSPDSSSEHAPQNEVSDARVAVLEHEPLSVQRLGRAEVTSEEVAPELENAEVAVSNELRHVARVGSAFKVVRKLEQPVEMPLGM